MRDRLLAIAALVSLGSVAVLAQAPAAPGYLVPPKVIVDILDAPPPPTAELSPARDVVALLERTSMPTIAELAQPMLRLAGVRINPKTNAPHRSNTRYRNLTLKLVADSSERKVTLPASPVLSWIGFSPDGRRFAFTNMRDNGVELWIGDTATGQAKAVTPAQLNAVFGAPCNWIGDGGSLLCAFTNSNRGAARSAHRPQRPGKPRTRGADAHRAGHADQRSRRGAVRVLRHQPARHRRCRHGPALAARPARNLHGLPALAGWPVHAGHADQAAVLVAGPL
ncbi:MAG: hypothetical protein WC815_09790 [Vicinamibacterales bacterium]|jgi:hypothetical protein